MSTPSIDEEKVAPPDVDTKVVAVASEVDISVGLVAGHTDDAPITPEESRRLRRKLDWHLLPLLWMIYTLQFLDKSSLGASSILGILADGHLTANDFNTLGSAFYIGYLCFELPQNYALQRLPVAKWLSFNIGLWAVFVGLLPLCHHFSTMFLLRFLLGAVESTVTAGLMILVSMFYTRLEIAERLGWTFQCNGIASIISGFIAFGAAHVNPKARPDQWQWLMIILAVVTVVCGILFFLFFPDNPTSARFLTQEEKIRVVKRVKGNQNGIETKKWKREQFIEALLDPKTWLFFFFAAISNLQSGYGVQYSIIIKSFGYDTLQTTLLSIPAGAAQVVSITLSMYMLRLRPNNRSYLAILFFLPSIAAAIALLTLPFQHKRLLLTSYYFINFGGAPSFVLVVSWVTSTCAGHTKRLTTNGIFLVGYALGQILCSQPWKQQYRPRNGVPWGINLATYCVDIILILIIRFILDRENKRRDAAQGISPAEAAQRMAAQNMNPDDDEFGVVEVKDESGNIVRRRVEKALLDMTDRENLSFRYVL